jgi:hypothetical protein
MIRIYDPGMKFGKGRIHVNYCRRRHHHHQQQQQQQQ